MYLITLDRISNMNVLKEIYLNVGRFKLQSIIYINNIIDFKSKTYNIDNIASDFLTIDIKNLKEDIDNGELTIEDIEECLYDLTELNREIVLKNINSSEEIFDLIKSIGISYIIPEDLLNPNFNKFNEIDTNTEIIIYDFFDKKHKFRRFTEDDFAIKLSIDNDGNIVYKHKVKANLLEDGFKALFRFENYDFDFTLKENTDAKLNKLLGNYMYDPHFFLIEGIDYEKSIFEVKERVFELIEEVSPERYSEMKQEVLDLFNKNNYIKISDIKKLISSNDKFLKLLK